MPKLTDLPEIDSKIRNRLRKAKITIEKLARMSPEELQQILPDVNVESLEKIIEGARRILIEEVDKIKEIIEFNSSEELYKHLEKFFGLDIGTIIITAQHPENLRSSINLPENVDVVWISNVQTSGHISIPPSDKESLKEFLKYISTADNKIIAVDCIPVLNENMSENEVAEFLSNLYTLNKENNKCVYVVIPKDLPENTLSLYRAALLEGKIPEKQVEVSEERPSEKAEIEKEEPSEKKEEITAEEKVEELEISEEAKIFLSLPHITPAEAQLLYEKGLSLEKISILTPIDLKETLPQKSEDELGDIIDAAKRILAEKSRKEAPERPTKIEIVETLPAEQKEGIKRFSIRIKKGFINGNGIVSSTGNFYVAERALERKIISKFAPVVVLLLLIVSIFPILTINNVLQNTIIIDGIFDDWNHISGMNINDIRFKLYGNEVDSYFYIEKKDMFKKFENIFIGIDLDGSNRSGYEAGTLGIDLVVSIYGKDGKYAGSSINSFKKISGGFTLGPSKGLVLKHNENKLEISVRSRNYTKETTVMFLIKDENNYISTPPLKLYKLNGILVADNNPYVIPNNYEVNIANVSFNAQDNTHVSYLKVSYTGATIKKASLVIDQVSYEGEIAAGEIIFTLNKPFSRFSGFLRVITEAPPQSVLKITNIDINTTANIHIVNKLSGIYVESVPQIPQIDGAFGDWKNTIRDSSYDLSNTLIYYPSIDILSSGVFYESYSKKIYLFLETADAFLAGDKIPLIKMVSPKDTDRDTIPDDEDPYPLDFNNDGKPDSETPSDVDGDGELDYPYGNDMFLNTTIPKDPIFGNYSGREISIYIGPAVEEPLKGHDRWVIYIDADFNPNTGYQGPEFKGADNKIEIIGRDRKIENIAHYRWFGYWVFIDKPNLAYVYNKCELSVSIRTNNLYRIGIYGSNWMNVVDYVHLQATRAKSSSYTYQTFYLHENNASVYEYMDWNIGNYAVQRTLQPSQPSVLWIYNLRMCENYTVENATVYLWLDPTMGSVPYTLTCTVRLLSINDLNNTNTYVELGRATRSYSYWYNTPLFQETFNIRIKNKTIPKGNYIGLQVVWSDIENDDYLAVWYNSSSYNSRLIINTTSTIECKLVWTQPDEYFETGERVYVYADVRDPLGPPHISSARMNVYNPDGSALLSSPMYRVDQASRVIFNYSFVLPSSCWVGTYIVRVDASDVSNVGDSNSTAFYILSNLSVIPRSNTAFCKDGGGIVVINHTIFNTGGGYDRYNLFATISPPSSIRRIILDYNFNNLPDGIDTILYQNGIVHVDEDGDGRADINIPRSERRNILIEVEVSSRSTKSTTSLYFIVESSLNVTTVSKDYIIFREVEVKQLYLRKNTTTNTRFLYPTPQPTDASDTGATSYTWEMTTPFANDVSLSGNIAVVVWLREGEGQCDFARISITLKNSNYLISSSTVPVKNVVEQKIVIITPPIARIPAGEILVIKMEGLDNNQQKLKKLDVYYGPTQPSRIEINTTSYIWVENVSTYLVSPNTPLPEERYNFSAGDKVLIRAKVRDPFGSYDVQSVSGYIVTPNGTAQLNFRMSLEKDYISYAIYNCTITLPLNSVVGNYVIVVNAKEYNGVDNYSGVSFVIRWNLSVKPEVNSSSQSSNVFYFNHTIYNYGDGYDCVDIVVKVSERARVELYIEGNLAAVDYEGDGTWEEVYYDSDNDGKPDTGWLPPKTYKRITIKITASNSSLATVYLYSYTGNVIYAHDKMTIVSEMPVIIPLMLLIGVMIYRNIVYRKTRPYKEK